MSFYVKIILPEGVGAEAREAFSALVPRLAARFSFQGLSDWAVDLGDRSRVLGVESEFHDLTKHGKLGQEMRAYFASKADGARFASSLRSVVSDIKVSPPRRQAQKDWMKEWRKHYKLQKIREGKETVWIVPAWKKGPKSGVKIRIYPGQAFGTGTHPTTQLCLRQFLKHGLSLAEGKVLDFGAGTGLLAIAAARYGHKVVTVESDPVALAQCRVNLKLNKVKAPALKKTPRGKFALVFANVLSPVLLQERVTLKSSVAKGGLLILSGILQEEARSFLKKFGSDGWKVLEIAEQGDWAAIAMVRL